MRAAVSRVLLRLLRVSVVCPAEVAAALARGHTLVTAHHVSLLDGPLVALTSPAPLNFAVHTDFSRRSPIAMYGMEALSKLGCGWVVPLDAEAPFGIRSLARDLKAGANVMVFPEGAISSGRPLPEKAGLAWVVERARPQRVHVKITGAERSRFFAKRGRAWLPRITLEYSLDEVSR
ncbi:1-acyl-sn-glycerol-3-phosphate acyltransferase [Paraburkholderia youngii]|uniref:1-acyl-sn-glycerol-3-phosphate acyltransferase n=1 Tax=Paraburkholderia youngii TaxID=2782701 RepID=UPI003D19502B